MKVNKSFTESVILINILNSKPILKNIFTHLYKLRKINYGYYKNSHIGLYVPNRDFTCIYNKGFLVRSYSTLSLTDVSNKDNLTDDIKMKNFYEWFSGFVDAEGCFYISISKICSFRFQINLHKDDINVLHSIQKSLGFGEVRSYKNYASFTVTRLKDIAQLLKIFDKYPLQGSKWLDYRDFVKAFELYTNSAYSTDVLKEITNIKNNMNRLRLDYTMPKDINISPYWLLGFIEGEGCFSINKHNNYRLDFSLCQSSTNLELMKSIKLYLENLSNTKSDYTNAISISEVKFNNPNQKSVIRIETARVPYITDVLIPFLEGLTWQSKKFLDFQDWKNILKLKEQGHHLTEKGAKLIDLIISQTNNRLSTSLDRVVVDREQLLAEVNDLLKGPSNFEIKTTHTHS
jgi:hypothetical protein